MLLIAGGLAYIGVAGLLGAPWWLVALGLPVLVLGAMLEARSQGEISGEPRANSPRACSPADPRTDADWPALGRSEADEEGD